MPRMIDAKCKHCGKDYQAKRYNYVKGLQQYCSIQCANKSRTKAVKLTASESTMRYRSKHRKKHLAHKKVQTAIYRGKLVKENCEVCGDPKTSGHHCDYDKPYEVMWLCRKHHCEWHRENGEGKNAR